MKPSAFEYHAPRTVEEAVSLLGELGDEAKVLAGGQSLVPMLAMRLAVFGHLVDVGRIAELRGIAGCDRATGPGATDHQGASVGATTVDSVVGADTGLARAVPLLGRVTPMVGHFQIRNRGTLGGSLAHADPAAEYPAVAVALDAAITCRSTRGERLVAAQDFFTGLWSTALAPDELLTSVTFPVWAARAGFGVAEFARRHGDFAIAGAVVALDLSDDSRVSRVAGALFGLAATPVRAATLEREVAGRRLDDCDPAELGALAVSEVDEVTEDLNGSAGYRRRVGAAMVERAWTDAAAEAAAGVADRAAPSA